MYQAKKLSGHVYVFKDFTVQIKLIEYLNKIYHYTCIFKVNMKNKWIGLFQYTCRQYIDIYTSVPSIGRYSE
jgi:hypothetical protein